MLGRLKQRSQGATPDSSGQPEHRVDPVTGTLSRESLPAFVEQAVQHSRHESAVALVVFVGVGLLRDVNDTLGPDAGDQLLRQVAQRLSTIDVPDTKLLRYGGAELALVFEKLPNAGAADEIGRFLIEFLAAPFLIGTEHITIDAHVGAALSADNYDTLDDMIRDAHQALVEAREKGRGTYVIHDESKRARYSTRIDDRRIHEAVDNNEFSLHYQPIVRLDNNDLIGVEALIRWSMPGATNTGVLYPHDFLPLLEKTGLIVEVGGWVLSEACRQAAEWATKHPARKRLFITCNLGARQLASTEFRNTVVAALGAHDVEPWQLCLDITEPALRYNRETTWAVLRDLKDMGVKLGLDDFGTGTSTLSYLREFKLDLLRVDRTFIAGLGMSREDAIIVKHVCGLAHDLGCHAIAEGVETEEQAEMLRDLAVDMAQGFHFGRPMTSEQIDDKLRSPDESPREDRWRTESALDFESP